jgi:hypothetical protein
MEPLAIVFADLEKTMLAKFICESMAEADEYTEQYEDDEYDDVYYSDDDGDII